MGDLAQEARQAAATLRKMSELYQANNPDAYQWSAEALLKEASVLAASDGLRTEIRTRTDDDYDADTIIATDAGGEFRTYVFQSGVDGVPVVQIDTFEHHGTIRVMLNDGAIWHGDPEQPAEVAHQAAADFNAHRFGDHPGSTGENFGYPIAPKVEVHYASGEMVPVKTIRVIDGVVDVTVIATD